MFILWINVSTSRISVGKGEILLILISYISLLYRTTLLYVGNIESVTCIRYRVVVGAGLTTQQPIGRYQSVNINGFLPAPSSIYVYKNANGWSSPARSPTTISPGLLVVLFEHIFGF